MGPIFLSLHWNHVYLLSLFGFYFENRFQKPMVVYWRYEILLWKYKPTLALISGPKRLPKGSVKDFSVVIALTLELFHFDILRPSPEYSSGTSSKNTVTLPSRFSTSIRIKSQWNLKFLSKNVIRWPDFRKNRISLKSFDETI